MTNRPTRARRRHHWVALAAASALVLSACGGGDSEDDAGDDATGTPSPSATAETPEGVELTEPGTQLGYGDSAVVDYKLRKQATLLELKVKNAVQGSLKDFAGFDLSDPYEQKANYYYVRVKVENVGEDPMGGVDVPLWGISGDNTLLPLVRFNSTFTKCDTQPLPKKFGPGKTHDTCLVFLSPNKGTLEGVSYRPEESFDPIEWRGQVEAPVTRAKQSKKSDKKKGSKKSGNG